MRPQHGAKPKRAHSNLERARDSAVEAGGERHIYQRELALATSDGARLAMGRPVPASSSASSSAFYFLH